MGRHNGSWSPIYGQAWDHEKTARAADWLASHDRRMSTEVAPFLVLGWLNRLCIWCLANSETGRTGGLSDARIATIAWPQSAETRGVAKAGALVRGALREGGFLENGGAQEQIHDFGEHHGRILKERKRKRDQHNAQDGLGFDDEDDSHEATNGVAKSAEPSAEHSARRSAERSAEPSAATSPHLTSPDLTGRGGDQSAPPSRSARSEPEARPSQPPDVVDDLTTKTADALDESDDATVAKAIRELLASGVTEAFLRTRIAAIDAPLGVWAWKRTVEAAWKDHRGTTQRDDPGTRPPDSKGVGAAQRAASREESERAERDVLQAFNASEYENLNAFRADRLAGEVRTGEAAKRRCWAIGRGAYDDDSPAAPEAVTA